MRFLFPVVLTLFSMFLVNACDDGLNDKIKQSRNELAIVADNINDDFVQIRHEAANLAGYIEELYQNQNTFIGKEDKSKYKFSDNGIFYKAENDGLSAVYVSGIVPVDEKVKNIVYFTAPLDQRFITMMDTLAEVAQVYYNDKNSYNRIYPYIDVLTQYGPKMNIPDYNFYYLADEKHNPEKNAVWVNDPYVDPAGRGWMVSAIAPVYYEDELAGVPGIDVTINTIISRYISPSHNEIIIVDKNGVLVAAEETSVNRLYLPPLKDHKYVETIKSDKFRKDDYNLLKSKNNKVRELARKIIVDSENDIDFVSEGESYLVLTDEIEEMDWKIFKLIEK